MGCGLENKGFAPRILRLGAAVKVVSRDICKTFLTGIFANVARASKGFDLVPDFATKDIWIKFVQQTSLTC
jgi:hypothetical protein